MLQEPASSLPSRCCGTVCGALCAPRMFRSKISVPLFSFSTAPSGLPGVAASGVGEGEMRKRASSHKHLCEHDTSGSQRDEHHESCRQIRLIVLSLRPREPKCADGLFNRIGAFWGVGRTLGPASISQVAVLLTVQQLRGSTVEARLQRRT